MRTAVTILYLLVMAIAISLVWIFQPPTNYGTLLMLGLGTAWTLALPWSLVTILVTWWFMHDYANPIFLAFFAGSALVNALLLNFGRIRNQMDIWNYNRRHRDRTS